MRVRGLALCLALGSCTVFTEVDWSLIESPGDGGEGKDSDPPPGGDGGVGAAMPSPSGGGEDGAGGEGAVGPAHAGEAGDSAGGTVNTGGTTAGSSGAMAGGGGGGGLGGSAGNSGGGTLNGSFAGSAGGVSGSSGVSGSAGFAVTTGGAAAGANAAGSVGVAGAGASAATGGGTGAGGGGTSGAAGTGGAIGNAGAGGASAGGAGSSSGGSADAGGGGFAGSSGNQSAIVLYAGAQGTQSMAWGGRAGLDALCAAKKLELGLLQSASRAFISVSATDDITTMPAKYGVPTGVPVVGPTGIRVGLKWSSLIGEPSLGGGLEVTLIDAGVLPVSAVRWLSGSTPYGTYEHNHTCNGWTLSAFDTTVQARFGRPDSTSNTWMSDLAVSCDVALSHLLCVAFDP